MIWFFLQNYYHSLYKSSKQQNIGLQTKTIKLLWSQSWYNYLYLGWNQVVGWKDFEPWYQLYEKVKVFSDQVCFVGVQQWWGAFKKI